jgi:phosphatidylinositol alpha-1,6-mannosyltransferase
VRVVIVSPEFLPDIGGVETYALEFVKELASRGYQVTVFTVRHPQGEEDLPAVCIEPVLKLCRAGDRETLVSHSADVWHALNAAYAWVAQERPNAVVSVHSNDFLRP